MSEYESELVNWHEAGFKHPVYIWKCPILSKFKTAEKHVWGWNLFTTLKGAKSAIRSFSGSKNTPRYKWKDRK